METALRGGMPDGCRIVFRADAQDAFGDVYVMAADGSNRVRLTFVGTADMFFNRDPVFSPDGSRVLYGSARGGSRPDLFLINATDGRTAVGLTSAMGASGPSYSRDGTRIAFSASHAPGSDDSNADIFVIPAAGGAPVRLTDDPAADLQPSFGP